MRFLRIFATLVLVWGQAASGQVGQIPYFVTPPASATYSGPGDVSPSAKIWYGLRAYSTAKAGTKAINLCDDAGANCADISTNATTGALNAPGTLGANNCNTSGTCTIAKFYDQSGNTLCTSGTLPCDIAQATNANRPTLNWNSGVPYAVFSGNPVTVVAPALPSAISQPYTASTVTLVSSVSGLQYTFTSSSGTMLLGYTTGPAVAQYAGGTIQTKAISLSTWYSTQGFYNGGASASSLEVNGSSSPTSVGANTYAAAPALSYTSGYFIGQFREGGLWAGAITDLTSNQRSFWGF